MEPMLSAPPGHKTAGGGGDEDDQEHDAEADGRPREGAEPADLAAGNREPFHFHANNSRARFLPGNREIVAGKVVCVGIASLVCFKPFR
jgi:hypothetical protein